MKMRNNLKLVYLSLLFCCIDLKVFAQEKLDDIIIENSILEDEIKSLGEEIKLLNGSIKELELRILRDSVLNSQLVHERNILEKQGSKEFMTELKSCVDSLDNCNTNLLDSINTIEKELKVKLQQLDESQNAIAGMNSFAEAHKQKRFNDNIQYTKKRYSQIELNKLMELKGNSKEFSNLKDFDEYIKRIDYTLSNLNIYNEGMKALDSIYDEKAISNIRDRIFMSYSLDKDNLTLGKFKLSEEQLNELDSLNLRLSRFKGGLIQLKKTIREINEHKEIKALRDTNNQSNNVKLINIIKTYIIPEEGSERDRIHDRYFEMVPYLKRMLYQYWHDINENPFLVPTETEIEIINIEVDE